MSDELIDEVRDFAAELRSAGVAAGAGRLRTALEALPGFPVPDESTLYWALRLCLCGARDDIPIFDRVFHARFVSSSSSASPALAPPGDGGTDGEADAAADGTAAAHGSAAATAGRQNAGHRVLTGAELAEIDVLRNRLAVRPTRPSRRWRRSRLGVLHLRATVRDMMRHDGEATVLHRRRRSRQPRRRLLLIDVSDSMREHSELLLRFAHAALTAAPRATEVFALSTVCVRITGALRHRDPGAALAAVERLDIGRGGGTRLAGSLHQFLRAWSGRVELRAATTLLASDGWDLARPEAFGREMHRLSRLTRPLIWINPQAEHPGFRPVAPALLAGLRHVDAHLPGGSTRSLHDLVELMSGEY